MAIDLLEIWKPVAIIGGALIATISVLANATSVLNWVKGLIGDRPKLHANVTITNRPDDEGNTIIINNLTAKPFMIDAWALLWVRKVRGRFEIVRQEDHCDDDFEGQTIKAHDRIRWSFRHDRFFVVDSDRTKGLTLILRLEQPGDAKPYDLAIWPFE